MKRLLPLILVAMATLGTIFAQEPERVTSTRDEATVNVGRTRSIADYGQKPHPFHIEARHWPQGCEPEKAVYDSDGVVPTQPNILGCGAKFYDYEGENLVTSAGETAYSKMMADTATQPASCNYVALTNTAITPAVGDTTLSGEIATNGLSRAISTFSDTSAAIGTPPTPSGLATVGTSGAATLYYWVFAHTYQGWTAVGSSANLTTANATLSNANYVTGSFTGKLGASDYSIVRTQGSGAPSGANAGGATQATTGLISAGYISCSTAGLTAGTAPSCTFADQSNTVGAFTVPASDQTFVGKYTLTKTFTASGTQSAQAFGILNASSNGTLCLEGIFTSASLVTNDTLAFTETVYHLIFPFGLLFLRRKFFLQSKNRIAA